MGEGAQQERLVEESGLLCSLTGDVSTTVLPLSPGCHHWIRPAHRMPSQAEGLVSRRETTFPPVTWVIPSPLQASVSQTWTLSQNLL